MTASTLPFFRGFWGLSGDIARSNVKTGPEPARKRLPVFIHDAVTPFQGETFLSVALRRDLVRESGSNED